MCSCRLGLFICYGYYMEKKKKMRRKTLDEVKDDLIGKVGTPQRDAFELELRMDLIGEMIKQEKKQHRQSDFFVR